MVATDIHSRVLMTAALLENFIDVTQLAKLHFAVFLNDRSINLVKKFDACFCFCAYTQL